MASNAIAVFKPMPWQIEPWRDKSQILLLTGSAGGGKSRIAAEKVHGFSLKYTNSTWLILRKAAEWTRKSIVPFFKQSVVGNDPRVRFNKTEGSFHYANGSTVFSGGMADDKQREAIRSIGGAGGLDGAWIEEANAFSRLDLEELLGRLRGRAADWRQLILTTNPGASQHWINKDLIQAGQAAVYRSCAADNPHNPKEYVDTLNRMTGVMHMRLAKGIWVNEEGAVYGNFDSTPGGIHVHERDRQQMVSFYLAMDKGFTNPSVILLIGEDSDGRLHVFKEFYERQILQSVVCANAKEWFTENDCRVAVVDDAAPDLIAELSYLGVNAKPAEKGKIMEGVPMVQNALAKCGDDLPRLTVDPTCKNLIGEFESYVWRSEKDEPVKNNDHALDALRYLFVYLHKSTGAIDDRNIESIRMPAPEIAWDAPLNL